MREHLRGLVENVLDPRLPESTRARHARTAAETMADIRDAYAAGQATLQVGRVMDLSDRGEDAARRESERWELSQLRDVASYPGLFGSPLVMAGATTGYGPAPLIREAATPWEAGLNPAKDPVVPGVPAGGPWSEVDPVLPLPEDTDQIITDVGDKAGIHLSIFSGGMTRQVADFTTQAGRALLDRIVLDDVDAKADAFIAGELIAAAGGTRAAGADLAGALDDAEGEAGARGVPQWLIVSPLTWPLVRRALAATWADGPRPLLLVSAGQPAGTVTVVGQGAVLLLTDDYMRMDAVLPKTLGRSVAIARPFYFQVRAEDSIQTVTAVA